MSQLNPNLIGGDPGLLNNLVNGANQPNSKVSNSFDALDESLLKNQVPDAKTNRTNQSGADLAEISMDLFNRLLKTSVIRASPSIKTLHDRKIVILDANSTARYQNGLLFASYLVVLKEVLAKVNQDFSIDDKLPNLLKEQTTPQARLFNWNHLCTELDKIGIIIESDIKSLYVAGDSEEIGKLFTRIERYMVRISGDSEILNFSDYRKDDRKGNKTGETNVDELNRTANGRRGLQSTQKKAVKDGVDIMQMDTTKEPSQTESTLEFILNTLCRALTMKPKQSAALLTNNNQFLTHCVVKGVKGRFEPMINWYQEIYQYSRHLSMMLEVEVENAIASGDPKQIKAAQQNFDKVLQTISCGCYSHNLEVAQLCMRTLACIAQDFAGNIELVQLTMKWFQSKDNGIYTMNYALKRHPEMAEDFVSCVGNYTGGGDQMTWVYMNTMQGFYPDLVEYFNCMALLFPFLSIKYSQELPEGNLLSQLIEKCIGQADNDAQNAPQVRIAALGLINEIWLSFPVYIEKQSQYANPIQHVYKKNSRDKTRSVRIVTAVCMFKLLDKFSAEKNPSAPAIYKALIFSLVESPQDQTVRELFLTNFQYLFETVKSIPVGLLVDPLVKSNQVQDTFPFQTFDYDFFAFLSQHPRLNIQNAIQILDLLARQYLNDVCNASAAAVPFIMICSRFLGSIQCQEFIMKFITISLNQLLQIDGNQDTRSTPGQNKGGKILALPAPGVRGSSSSMTKGSANKEFRISQSGKKASAKAEMINNRAQSQEEEINNRLKKSQIIVMLLKIQNLRQGDVNNAMRDMLLGAQKQYKDQNSGYLHNGIMAVLKHWGDPDLLFNQFLKRQEKIEAEEKKAYEKLQRQEQIERRMLGYESEDKPYSSPNAPYQSLSNVKSLKSKSNGRNSMALMPITENTQNLRAMQELEMIKKLKRDKELQERQRQEQLLKKQTVDDRRLREQLKKRRVEIGVAQNVGGVKQEIKALIYKDEESNASKNWVKARNPIENQVQLVDLKEEEDRDREIIVSFMKRNGRIWKFLFGRYANQCYSSKQQKDFNDIARKTSQISLAEITKMLRDHNTYPILLNKDELAALLRLINMNSQAENSSDLAMLDYKQFIQFIPQLAFLCFSRPPIDKSSFPPIESLNALLTQFEQATRDRGKNTMLYEDPDQSSFQDRELMAALEAKVNEDEDFPVPEGFKKVVEKVPIYNFNVPACAAAVLKESQVVATEMMDQILFEAVGVHFLEPQVSFSEKYKIKTAITKQKKPASEPHSYMKPKAKKNPDEQSEAASSKAPAATAHLTAAEKRLLELEVKPKINLALKLQVTKQDLKARPHYQEVAEVFEEMLQATEKGLEELPPRLNRAPGQVQNEVKNQKHRQEIEALELENGREARRAQRDGHVKKLIKDTNYGGREMKIEKYKKLKAKTDKKTQEEEERKARAAFQEQAKIQKEEVDLIKKQNLDQLKEKKELERAKEEIEKKQEEKLRKEFLAKQKKQLRGNFAEQAKLREDIVVRQEETTAAKKATQESLKKRMNDFIKESKPDREQEKKERADVADFMKTPDVQRVLESYHKQLNVMYKFYASQDTKNDYASFDLEYLHSVLSFKELVRFGYQQGVTPDFISPDDMVQIYKNLVREQQEGAEKAEDKQSLNHRTSGMIDYDSFLKALVRISIMAQEKLGSDGANQDLLKAKLQRDTEKKEAAKKQKKEMLAQIKKKDQEKRAELDKLKAQFQEEQEYKAQSLSKAAKVKVDKNGNPKPEAPATEQKPKTKAEELRENQEKYRLDQAKLDQEEEFFKKWLKQRENLGLKGVLQEEDQKEQDDDNVTDVQKSARRGTITKALDQQKKDQQALKKKDMTAKELADLEKEMKAQKKLKRVKIDRNQVRKPLDVNIISAQTLESLIKYLDLSPDDDEHEVNKKLNQTLNNRKQSTFKSPANKNKQNINLTDKDKV